MQVYCNKRQRTIISRGCNIAGMCKERNKKEKKLVEVRFEASGDIFLQSLALILREMKLSDLPLPLLIEIFAFAEHWVEKPYLNRNAKLWRDFITLVCPKYRKESIFLQLNTIHSLLYMKSEEFRQHVLQRIQYKQFQLGFCLDSFCCKELKDQDDLDLSTLDQVYYLKLRNINVTSLSKITSLTVLEVIDCSHISDVSRLGFVQKLLLFNCSGITDVTGLGSVKELSLYQCPNLRHGFTTLTKVRRLCIEDDNLRTTTGFESIQELYLTCRKLQSISSSFHQLRQISLHFCQSIRDVTSLSHVPEVSFTYCDNITNLDCLTHTKRLSITNCTKISQIDLTKLFALTSLHVGYCPIQQLHIPSDSPLQTLSVTVCSQLRKVDICPILKTVSIYGCATLQDIVIRNRLRSIQISYNSQCGPRVNIQGTVNSVLFTPITF